MLCGELKEMRRKIEKLKSELRVKGDGVSDCTNIIQKIINAQSENKKPNLETEQQHHQA